MLRGWVQGGVRAAGHRESGPAPDPKCSILTGSVSLYTYVYMCSAIEGRPSAIAAPLGLPCFFLVLGVSAQQLSRALAPPLRSGSLCNAACWYSSLTRHVG